MDSAVIQFDEAAAQERGQPRLPAGAIRAALGGLAPLYIDWNWLKALTDDALVRLPRQFRTRLYHVLDETTELDPAFFQAYTIGGNLLAIVRDDVFGARDLLLKGVRYMRETLPSESIELRNSTWRETWRLNMQLGYVYLFELEDIPSAEQYFVQAASHPDAPLYVRNLGRRLETPEGRFIIAGNLLSNLLNSAKERKEPAAVTEELELKLKSLKLAHFFFQANQILDQHMKEKNTGKDSSPRSFKSRLAAFEKLKDAGVIPARDPQGSSIRLEASSENPTGTLMSSTERKPVFGF